MQEKISKLKFYCCQKIWIIRGLIFLSDCPLLSSPSFILKIISAYENTITVFLSKSNSHASGAMHNIVYILLGGEAEGDKEG